MVPCGLGFLGWIEGTRKDGIPGSSRIHASRRIRSSDMNIALILAQAASDGSSAAGFFFGLGAVWLIVALLLGVFWLWMLIDALTNTALEPPMKIVWALLI